ncbi:MAG: heme ABC transporter ATP-binding protein [Opitutales bacterium]
MIRVDQLSFARGRRHILDAVSLDVQPGRITAVIGPNGAGKSTLLKILSGELAPASGDILWDDRPFDRWPRRELAQRFAVLPQHSSMTFDFAVEEIVWMGRTPHRRTSNPEKDAQIVTHALERLDLLSFRYRLYTRLSGGERQRVHLARVLAQIWEPLPDLPRYCFLDEPTSSLDLKHQHAILRQARELADRGAGVFVVLHDLSLVRRYADHVLTLKDGRSAGFGPVDEQLTRERLETVFEVSHDLIPGLEAQFLPVPAFA